MEIGSSSLTGNILSGENMGVYKNPDLGKARGKFQNAGNNILNW